MTRSITIRITLGLVALAVAAVSVTVATARTVDAVAPPVLAQRLTVAYLERDWDAYWRIAAPGQTRAAREQAANLARVRDTEWGVSPDLVISTTVLDTSGEGTNLRTVRVLAATGRGSDLFVWRLVHDDEGWRVLSHDRNPGGSSEP